MTGIGRAIAQSDWSGDPVFIGADMKILSGGAVAFAAIALTGCATILSGSTQTISVSTLNVTGANCVLTSARGSWTLTTPGTVEVKRSKDDIVINCDKPGYEHAVAVIPSGLEETAAADILMSYALPIGAAVDASTGAMNQYPHTFELPMHPSTCHARC